MTSTQRKSKTPATSEALNPVRLIMRKREGGTLEEQEIHELIEAYTKGDLPDYQMSALAMAIFFQGMSPDETVWLTQSMRDSGTLVDLSHVPGFKVDKHSTGGVGDKVSICLAPLVAACGVPVPMVSGRGLGHTGGTLDKLEAIPGFRVDLSVQQFRKQVAKLGCALMGQTEQLAPADKRLYALRDVTGTVESIPLITASILSKKLAEGIDALVLDVKVGSGAFMKTQKDARALARSLVRVGTLAGKRVTALLTSMQAPLGFAVGNALETAEAFRVLLGEGPEDVLECTLALGAEMLRVGGVTRSESRARRMLEEALHNGDALRKMEAIVRAQKGDPRVVSEPDRLPQAKKRIPIAASTAGYVHTIDAMTIGLCAVEMGAGRTRADQSIDPAVGIMLQAKPGDSVQKGQTLAEMHVHKENATGKRLAKQLREAIKISARPPRKAALILERIAS